MHRPALLLVALLAFLSPLRADTPAPASHVKADLFLETPTKEGLPVTINLQIESGWHLYWRNPGDAGRAIQVKWNLPEGWTAQALEWPVPKLFSVGNLTDYGYEGTVGLFALLTPPSTGAKLDPAKVSADLSWLVCNPQTCVPGKATALPVRAWAGPIASRQSLPQALPTAKATLREEGDSLRLSLSDAPGIPATGPLRFIPYQTGIIANGERQFAVRSAQGVDLRIKKSPLAADRGPLPGTVVGLLLAVDAGKGWEISAKVLPPLPGAPLSSPGFPWAALGLAFFGGLLLNLMPCVLPVLSLKVLALVSMPKKEGLRHGLGYTAGVLVSFLALAGLLLALRAAGGRFGWGFQLQSPPFVVFIAALFFGITLNLLGLFEIGEGLAAKGGAVLEEKKKSLLAPFLGGLLAVVVATPCTAPFMGTALGVAFSQPASIALLIFAALGLGLALPYLVLAANPAWLRFVPKSGGWMIWFRRILAVPMAATVVWLVWVFHRETGGGGVLLLSLGAILCAAALFGQWEGKTIVSRLVVRTAALLLAGIAVSAAMVYKGKPPAPSASAQAGDWIPFSASALDAFREAGQPVFVDFTADWCLPCQVNKVVLDSSEVSARFKEKHVVRMLADWTRNDPAVTAALADAGQQSVPLYVLYGRDPSVPPKLLPAILTKQIVLDALDELK